MNNILRFVLFMVPLGLPVTNTFGATPTRPSVTFTSTKNGARWSNDVFTVTGKVNYADNGSVLPPTVWYSSNRGSWAQTDTTLGKGSGTWSAQVTLTPGTNSIAVYAVEEVTENQTLLYSPTNTVKLDYVLTAKLTVATNGEGTIKPDYNGDVLAIGDRYSVVATPANGFGFRFWNVGAAMSNRPTLDFTMVSNLVITANFKDITPPTVAITAPKAGEKYSDSAIEVTGTTHDNVGVTAVGVQINDTGWVIANGTTSWSAGNLPVISGANTVHAYAIDAAGNVSTTRTVKFLGVLPPDWAPTSLVGSSMLMVPSSGDPITINYGASTFSQTDANTTANSGVGTYIYNQTATNMADLSLTFKAPPSITNNGTQDIQLNFTNVDAGTFTKADSTDTGTFSIEPADALGVFGIVNGKATPLKVDLGSGSSAVFTLQGGTGSALQSGSEIDLEITATSTGAALSVTVQGDGMVPFGYIDVTGSLDSIHAPASTISGSLTISRSLGTAALGAISGNIEVAEGITSLTAGQLDGTLSAGGSVGQIKLGGVNGRINVVGNIDSLTTGDVSGSIYTSGSLALAMVGNVTGLIASASLITSLQTLNITGATILAGANLGADGQIGGTGVNADTYGAGTIGIIRVVGAIDNSFVGAGVVPGSSGFGSSTDASAGASLIRSIYASDGATGSKFESSAFGIVELPEKIDPTTNPQFIIL